MTSYIFRIIALFIRYGIPVTAFTVLFLGGNTPPSLQVLAPGDQVMEGEIMLAAEASDSDGSINYVEFFINEALVERVAEPPYRASVNLTPGRYTYTIVASDNRSGMAVSHRDLEVLPGNNSPTILAVSPENGAGLLYETTTFSVQAEDSDGMVVAVRLFIDGELIADLSEQPYSVAVQPSRGAHTLRVEVEDDGGAVTSREQNFSVVANIRPRVTGLSPASGSQLFAGPVTVTIAADDPDGSIVASELLVNGASAAVFAGPPEAREIRLEEGVASVEIRLTDNEGLSSSTTATWNVLPSRNNAPSITLTSPLNGSAVDAFPQLLIEGSFSDLDEGDVLAVRLYVDGQLVATPESSPFSVAVEGLVPGQHSVVASVTDLEGANDQVTIGVTVVQPPVIAELVLPVNSGLVMLTYGELSLENPGSDPATWEFYADGEFLLSVHSTLDGEPQADDRFYFWLPQQLEAQSVTVVPGPRADLARMQTVDVSFQPDAETIADVFAPWDTIPFDTNGSDAYQVCGFTGADFVMLDTTNPWNPTFLENPGYIDINGMSCALISYPDRIGDIVTLVASPDYITITE